MRATAMTAMAAVTAAAVLAAIAPSGGASAAAARQEEATEWPGRGRVLVNPRVVWVLRDGVRTAELPATQPPAGVAAELLTATRVGRGYRIDVAFAEKPFVQLGDLGGRPAQHTVAAVLVPPSGDPWRVVLLPDGRGVVEQRRGAEYVTVRRVRPELDGGTVRFSVPASVGARPDWEVRADVEVRDDQDDGFYSVTASTPLGNLTGETERGEIVAPRRGVAVEQGVPVASRPASLPDSARPSGLVVEVDRDRVLASVHFAGKVTPVGRVEGRPVTVQVLNVQVASSFDDAFAPLVFSYDVIGRTATVYDTRALGGPRRAARAEVDGDRIVFDLGPAPGQRAGADEAPFRLRSAARSTMTVLDDANDGVELGSPFVEGSVLLAGERAGSQTTGGATGRSRGQDDGDDDEDDGGLPAGAVVAIVAVAVGALLEGLVVARRRRGGCGAEQRAVAQARRRVSKAVVAVERAYGPALAAEERLSAVPLADADARAEAGAALRTARSQAAAEAIPALAALAQAQDDRRAAEQALAACRERPAAEEPPPVDSA